MPAKPASVQLPKEWPAAQVTGRKVADLVPYARNARTHSEAQVAQIAASIREWGWTVPVLVDEQNTIIAGHGRVLAAQQLGYTEVPVTVARGWTEAQRRAYVLADNKLTLNGGWDKDTLRLELAELQGLDFALDLTGFDANEVNKLLDPTADLPDLSGEPGLGEGLKHQVVVDCHDEADQAAVLERLKGEGRACRPLTL